MLTMLTLPQLVLLVGVGIGAANAKLSTNANGSPQELNTIDASVCADRSSGCSVLMVCMTTGATTQEGM